MKTIVKHYRAIILISCIIMLFTGTLVTAQTSQQRYAAVGFSIGDKGYIGTGIYIKNITYYKKDFWEYNTATDSWTQKADLGGAARGFAVGFSIGNKGYIGTGSIGSEKLNDFWEYNPTNNSWSQKASVGGPGRAYAVGFSIGNKGYIGTGMKYVNGELINVQDFWEYDPVTDTWAQVADYLGGLRHGAAGFSIGAKGYVGTGLQKVGPGPDDFLWYNDFYEFDPATNSWSQKATFGGITRGFAVGFNINAKGYIGTGNSSVGLLKKDLWEYDPGSDTWLQKADLGGAIRSCASAFSIGTKGYIGTGLKAQNQFLADFWEYNPASNVWTQKTDLGKKHKGAMKESDALVETGQEGAIDMVVYPNPSNSTFNFRMETNSKDLVGIQLFDLSGRLVQEYQSLSPDDIITVGENLDYGVYIAVVAQGASKTFVKIAKVQ
jgi:N-acetylneuraminic acid mutarotase